MENINNKSYENWSDPDAESMDSVELFNLDALVEQQGEYSTAEVLEVEESLERAQAENRQNLLDMYDISDKDFSSLDSHEAELGHMHLAEYGADFFMPGGRDEFEMRANLHYSQKDLREGLELAKQEDRNLSPQERVRNLGRAALVSAGIARYWQGR